MKPNPEFDKPGYCAKCHLPIAEFDGANNIVRILGNARHIQVRLDDNSLMNVVICEKCKESFKPEEVTDLMDSVLKGWMFECDTLVEKGEWTSKKRDKHIDKYSQRYIVERTDDSAKWSRETIVDAVFAEAIKAGEEEAKKRGIKWPV